jgi:putative glutamine amidotransferase
MTRRAPLIGITADLSAGRRAGTDAAREPTHFLPQRYCRAITDGGGVTLILPSMSSLGAVNRLLDVLDGLLISGGDFDIHPSFYGEKPLPGLGVIKPERTQFELEVAAAALKRDLPVLGLCGGAQAINVVLGGTLYQDIATQVPRAGNHQQAEKKASGGHRIFLHRDTRLREIIGRGSVEVNTTHHQAVKRTGKGLIINATAEDGLIEGIESEQHSFVLGVQWHPEVLAVRYGHQRRIIESFIQACRGQRNGATRRARQQRTRKS